MTHLPYKLKNIKSVILHEFGHLFGYCIANKNNETFFCKPLKIDFGYKNFITPSKKIYHIENFTEDRLTVIENSKNIKKTTAWFLEVISGCDFETEFEKTNFLICFCPTQNCSGSRDFANLSVIKNLSSFNWTFDDIYILQSQYRKLLTEYNVYTDVGKVVEQFLDKYGEKDFHIIENDELDFYTEKINEIITQDLYNSYLTIIRTTEKTFS